MADVEVVTFAEINTAIIDTLEDATGITRAQDHTELTEQIPDLPLIQGYWYRVNFDATSGSGQRAFRGAVREKTTIFRVDLYARQRSHIAEDVTDVILMVDALMVVLEAQKEDRFGLGRAVTWEGCTGQFTNFDHDGRIYVGARFEITLRVH